MLELATTRANPLVDPFLHAWGWEIPIYLFLGGWVAGMMIITGVSIYAGRHQAEGSVFRWLPALGLVLLSAGMLALFLDLEHKAFVWRLYTTFRMTSPMSWGAWILLLVYPALLAAALVRFASPRMAWWIATMSIVLGVALGIYTGVLLSGLGARPFWSSALLGPLFLLSGMSAAAAFTHMAARNEDERVLLAKADNVFLVAELAVIGLFLVGLLNASQAHAEAARLVLGGPFTAVFWVGVVGLGIVLPLMVQSLAVTHRVAHTPVAPLFVLVGGVVLRFVFVAAGQYSRWPM